MTTLNSGATPEAAGSLFDPRQVPRFRAWLTFRLAVPLDRHAKTAVLKLAGSTALAAPPLTIALIAPTAKLTLSTVFGLCCAGLPGFAATAWTAAGLSETRQRAARGLRQAGAEHRLAWLIAAARLSLFAGAGTLLGNAFLAVAHAPLGAVLPKHSPLRGMFAADAVTWLIAVALTALLVVAIALLASSPLWARVDWTRFAVWRHVNLPAVTLPPVTLPENLRRHFARPKQKVRAPQESRQPR